MDVCNQPTDGISNSFPTLSLTSISSFHGYCCSFEIRDIDWTSKDFHAYEFLSNSLTIALETNFINISPDSIDIEFFLWDVLMRFISFPEFDSQNKPFQNTFDENFVEKGFICFLPFTSLSKI